MKSGRRLTRRAADALAILAVCVVTAYTINDAGMDGRGITATGSRARVGVTAGAAWQHHPPGQRVWLAGLGWRTIEDTGGAARRWGPGRLDVLFGSTGSALAWGRRAVACDVLHGGHRRGAF